MCHCPFQSHTPEEAYDDSRDNYVNGKDYDEYQRQMSQLKNVLEKYFAQEGRQGNFNEY